MPWMIFFLRRFNETLQSTGDHEISKSFVWQFSDYSVTMKEKPDRISELW